VPLPHSVTCPVRIQARQAAVVYVEIPGILETMHVQPGARVTAGQPLVTLRDADLALAVAQLENQRRDFACRLDGLRRRALLGDPQAAEAIAAVRRAIAAFDEQLEKRRRDIERLQLTAPCDGVVLAADRPLRRESGNSRGGGPERTALDRRQIGASLVVGQPVCQIGEPTRLEAFLELDQTQLASLRPGQEVWILLDHAPNRRFVARIEEITQSGLAASPSSGRPAPRRAGWFFGAVSGTASASDRRPPTATFAARCRLDDPDGAILIGATGRARVFTGYRTLWSLAQESISRMVGP
jgi:multidrug resistance efflux pump